MYILAFETTGAFASAALADEKGVISYVQGKDRFSHLQNLMPQTEQVIHEGGITLKELAAIAVSKGPGSFTGIRIGVSSARALSQALDIPCVGVSSLEALALNAAAAAEEGALICPVLDARRSQVYGGGYLIKDGFPEEIIKAAPYTIEEFMGKVAEYDRILMLGDGTDACGEIIEKLRPAGRETAKEAVRYQKADSVARLALKIFREEGGVPYGRLQPEYMRVAEAERRLAEKRKAQGKGALQKEEK
ncbi:MAG TPA: tRNA (adenosine(37)-N6)-threonylcarbamoyltransferase complex dimerization subunit type 1 TsaB [Candidatus Copromorpha excrementigallinarum]|uniref:N(6)-L-threonylcarbamoyladenine synthase n=1 Tax=Candidatus Allocopromorpha excrementigallinarum TaxID=2840742 RepID=A0A9D1I202_9FIRM|nr:tRNA (adenosine(37)-N6)-threonylcarbamoyltransferase complex dimerization subunit type 1 TsaB [Candidatus Copromorpha excrementigallinarum]